MLQQMEGKLLEKAAFWTMSKQRFFVWSNKSRAYAVEVVTVATFVA